MQFFKFLQTLALIAIFYIVIAASQPLDYNERHENTSVKRHQINKRHHSVYKRHNHKRHNHKRQTEACTNEDPNNESDKFAVKSCKRPDGTPYIESVDNKI
ncbi:hypothetical protein Glove_460g55 [Diversispora epigaea]|uniref:Secreted protein n=1 Tax=Diversispora epigaea TaxID=1348612 RepID=A0A397GP25_9GLOM|nr:hypothetical protein Glove_460g55 [Diversispora epigaea]